MENKTMFDIVSSFRVNMDSDLEQSYFGEVDIIINLNDLFEQDPCTEHSEFVILPGTTAYIAGISGMQGASFTNISDNDPNQLDDFFHSTNDWNDVVIDAEKSANRSWDKFMCWAATDSNLLYRTGWLTSSTLTVDNVFDKFRDAFYLGETHKGHPTYGACWYLYGVYGGTINPSLYDQLWPADSTHPEYERGFFSDSITSTNIGDYVVRREDQDEDSTILIDAMNDLRAGNAVGLGVIQVPLNGEPRGHAITLQGYTYQAIENSSNIRITGIIIADSDDDMGYVYEGHVGYSYAPNKLVYIPVHNVFGDVFLDWNYMNEMYNGWSPAKIFDTTTVKPANYTTMADGDDLVRRGATLLHETVQNGYVMNVSKYGLAMETAVNAGGILNVSSGGSALNTLISAAGTMNVSKGGKAEMTSLGGGNAQVFGGGVMILDNQAAASGNVTLGGQMVVGGSINCNYLTVGYDLDADTPQNDPLITNLSNMGGINSLALNIDWMEKYGTYTLASSGGDFLSSRSVYVYDTTDNNNLVKTLNNQSSTAVFSSGAIRTYNMEYTGGVLTLDVGGPNINKTTRCDFHYNGISDVIYISGGTDGQTIQYGLDGTSELQDEGILDSDVRIVGGYDMDWDHRVDLVTCRTAEYDSTDYLVVEYAQSGDMGNLQEIDRISIFDNVDWNVYCGNLAGHDWKNSILWHAPDLGTLGYWADGGGNESWVGIGNVYDSSWEVIGLGDFIDDSVRKDAVLFKYDGNAVVEITASGGYRALGTLGSGWDIVAIGDFSNDGVDDLILYNGILCQVGKWTDGVSTGWSSLGLVETGTTIEGAGDYDGDGGMDLLARKSDGTMGYYASANLSQFTSFGYTMDSSWTVIA